jgi:predicted enzyme related to lactoylglutathione lyase
MSPVSAIGGAFFRAEDPAALASWYARAFGLSFGDEGGTAAVLPDVGGAYSVFALFPADSAYLGDPSRQQAMVNLRTEDLDELLAHLDSEGIAHDVAEDSEYGRFAWTTDPEGNRVELWQPAK